MKRNFKPFVLLLALALAGGQLNAQFTTTFSKNVNPGQHSGFYYALPQTMLRLDFVIEETQCEQGPLAGYASNYFGGKDYAEYSFKEYKLLDVTMTSVAAPDPNATFFVNVNTGRGAGKVDFDLLPNGIIRSVGVGNAVQAAETEELAVYPQADPLPMPKAKSSDFLTMMSSGKSDAQLAREAADKIEEIRKAKLNLVSGYYETAYVPESLQLMFDKLDELEAEYMSLFVGSRVTQTVVRSIYVIPSKEVATQTVAKFSESEGLSTGSSGMGSPIMVQTLPLNVTAAINAPSQSAIESMSYENKVFYRVPEMANVKVTFRNGTLVEERLPVNQLGALLMAPLSNTRLVFDTQTGQIVNMRME